MSTRAGKFVSADDLITEVNKRAFDDVSIGGRNWTKRPEGKSPDPLHLQESGTIS